MGQSETHCVRRDGLEPVVVEVEQHHLRLRRLQDQVSELLHLQTGLEGQLQLRAFDHDVGEVEQVDLHRETTALDLEGIGCVCIKPLGNYIERVSPPGGPTCPSWLR